MGDANTASSNETRRRTRVSNAALAKIFGDTAASPQWVIPAAALDSMPLSHTAAAPRPTPAAPPRVRSGERPWLCQAYLRSLADADAAVLHAQRSHYHTDALVVAVRGLAEEEARCRGVIDDAYTQLVAAVEMFAPNPARALPCDAGSARSRVMDLALEVTRLRAENDDLRATVGSLRGAQGVHYAADDDSVEAVHANVVIARAAAKRLRTLADDETAARARVTALAASVFAASAETARQVLQTVADRELFVGCDLGPAAFYVPLDAVAMTAVLPRPSDRRHAGTEASSPSAPTSTHADLTEPGSPSASPRSIMAPAAGSDDADAAADAAARDTLEWREFYRRARINAAEHVARVRLASSMLHAGAAYASRGAAMQVAARAAVQRAFIGAESVVRSGLEAAEAACRDGLVRLAREVPEVRAHQSAPRSTVGDSFVAGSPANLAAALRARSNGGGPFHSGGGARSARGLSSGGALGTRASPPRVTPHPPSGGALTGKPRHLVASSQASGKMLF